MLRCEEETAFTAAVPLHATTRHCWELSQRPPQAISVEVDSENVESRPISAVTSGKSDLGRSKLYPVIKKERSKNDKRELE